MESLDRGRLARTGPSQTAGFEARVRGDVREIREDGKMERAHAWRRLWVAVLCVTLLGLPMSLLLHRDLTHLIALTEQQTVRTEHLHALVQEDVRLARLLDEEAALRRQRFDVLQREIALICREVDAQRKKGRRR